VDLIQKLGHLLHLVDDHRLGQSVRGLGQQALTEQRRSSEQIDDQIGVEQVEAQAVGESVVQVGRLAGLAGAPQECRLPRRQVDVEHSGGSWHDGNALLICQANTDHHPKTRSTAARPHAS
jgi:hypothetical protein